MTLRKIDPWQQAPTLVCCCLLPIAQYLCDLALAVKEALNSNRKEQIFWGGGGGRGWGWDRGCFQVADVGWVGFQSNLLYVNVFQEIMNSG